MSFWDEIKQIAAAIKEFFISGDAQKLLGEGLQVALIIVKIVSMFNEPPPKERQPQVARDILKFIKYAPTGMLIQLEALKSEGGLDKMSSGDMDRVLGLAIGQFVDEKKKPAVEVRKGGGS